MKIGERLKALRIQNKFTQKEVADELKINQSNISDWENDISRPEYEHLIALAQLYNESLESILGIE